MTPIQAENKIIRIHNYLLDVDSLACYVVFQMFLPSQSVTVPTPARYAEISSRFRNRPLAQSNGK